MVFKILFICIQFGFLSAQLDIVTDETPLEDRGACISNPCLHNGMCTVTSNGFICTCVNSYIGVNCERRADDCPRDLSMKCVHGVCKLDMNGNPKCICKEGFEGPICSLQVDNCASNPCLNSGTCIDKVGGYKCKCKSNTRGSHCQIKDDEISKCLNSCGEHYYGGKCWHNGEQKISVGWGLGEPICNTLQTCFNASKGQFDDHEYIPAQLKPIQMQDTDDLVFITDRDASLYDHHFIPHILPMEASSRDAFEKCNTTNALPLTKNISISKLNVNDKLLHPGIQYFIANMNHLYRCDFGLRLNVTVKEKACTDPKDLTPSQFCNGRGKCYTDFTQKMYSCLCCEGYAGKYCQHEDPCVAKPCSNNGQCKLIDIGSGMLNHECECQPGYHGKQCEKKINHCQSYPCQNDGACYPELGDFRCQCKEGFSGKQCEVS
uniref:EGF-like domain-containing protein n=1 Tax=Clytia hemisphaerica TaxID=252671 RepID=A0A7M5U177_9CNID